MSSFSVPEPSKHWIHCTPTAAKQFRTKKLLGMTTIILEMPLSEPRTHYFRRGDFNSLVVSVDAERQLYVIKLTL